MLSRRTWTLVLPIVAAFSFVSAAQFANAQSTTAATAPDSVQIMASLAGSMRLLKPAEFLLAHRADLALTPDQVTQLNALVHAQADSANVRAVRMQSALMASATAKVGSGKLSTGMAWGEPVDEDAIRSMMKLQSALQEEGVINMARDRHAAGAVLTATQIALIPQLELADPMKAMKH